MSASDYKPASPEQLEREAKEWDLRVTTPESWEEAPEAIPQLGASTSISLRMPTQMLAILKAIAARQGVGYQVLLKRWLDDRIREEREQLAAEQTIRLEEPSMVSMAASFEPDNEQVEVKSRGKPEDA